MREWIISLVTVAVLGGSTVNASAEIIAKCGELSGVSYDYETARWVQDSIGGGATIITRTDNEYDILFVDSTDKTKSDREQGAKVAPVNGDKTTMHIFAVYIANITEIYSFDAERSLLMLLAERLHPFKTSKMMIAKCL